MTLVTIVLATSRSRPTLYRAIESVWHQTWKPVELIVVADGPDARARELCEGNPDIRYIELGRNWHAVTQASWGCEPRVVGGYLARGAYIGYLDDDDVLLPRHCEIGASIMDADTTVDAVVTQMRDSSAVYGDGMVAIGHIGTPMVLHRREVLRHGVWFADGHANDGRLYRRWALAGVRFVHVPEVTCVVRPETVKGVSGITGLPNASRVNRSV